MTFRTFWWSTDLERAGLQSVRPRHGTYGRYPVSQLPALPFELDDGFAWLHATSTTTAHIGRDRAQANATALVALRLDAERHGHQLPSPFVAFMASAGLQGHVRSPTDCYLDLSPVLVPFPLGEGYLVRFLADSQGCLFWYLYLSEGGDSGSIVCSEDFYGTEAEQWQEEPPTPEELVAVAPSFEAFLGRFWLESEIWFATAYSTPLPVGAQEYLRAYLAQA